MQPHDASPPDHAIAIIGAGFAGTMLAIQLRRRLPAEARLLLVERGGAHGPGLAYGTTDPHHLLNVPAKGMSAFPDEPGHFLAWLEGQPRAAFGPLCDGPAPDAFVPRMLFGAYLRALLAEAVAAGGLTLATSDVQSVSPRADGGFAITGTGLATTAGQVVLATGNPPPGASEPPFLQGNPWAPGALDGLPPEAPLLIVGAGLTMADLVLTLRHGKGHRGPIHVISRHGWLPLPHATPPLPGPWKMPEQAAGLPPSAYLRALRQAVAEAAAAGSPWQTVPDGIRPQIQRLWRGASLARRARFLRHASTAWNIHRHRIAPRLAQALAEAAITPHAARLTGWEPSGDGVMARLRARGGAESTIAAARILLCTGPGADHGWLKAAPLAGLVAAGLARPEPLHLGLDIDPDSLALHGADGAVVPGLFAIGPTAKGVLWEATAVPELRQMAAALAGRLAGG